MKRRKNLIMLMGVLALLSTFTILINHIEEEKITANEKEILSLSMDEITEISWAGDESFSFYKDEEWYYKDDEAFPVDEEEMNYILEVFEHVISTFEIENVTNYAQYGLDNPDVIIHIQTDKSYTISLGNYSDIDNQRYASIGDGKVYLLKEDIYDSLNITLNELMEVEEIPTMSKLLSFEISGENNLDIIYDQERDDYLNQYVYYLKEENEYLSLDTTSFNTFVNVIGNIEWKDIATYDLNESDLKKYGLENPSLNVSINYEENDKEDSFEIDFGTKNDKYYTRIKNSNYVYEIDEEVYNKLLTTKYNDLRSTNIISVDWKNVNSIEFIMDDYYSVELSGNDEIKYKYNDEYVELDDAINQLDILEIQEFNENSPKKSRELKIMIHQDVDNYEEIEISIYKEDGENSLVVVNDETLGFVMRSDVVDLIEEINCVLLNVE